MKAKALLVAVAVAAGSLAGCADYPTYYDDTYAYDRTGTYYYTPRYTYYDPYYYGPPAYYAGPSIGLGFSYNRYRWR